MSWNIEKPGDRINGPVTITGNTTLTGAATISGDLTVDTSTLKVDSANNRVGVNTATPSVPLDVVGNAKVSGDLVVDTNTLVVDSTNNRLGIGTATPPEALSVIGKIYVESANPDVTAIRAIATTGTNAVSINLNNTGGNYFIGVDNSAGNRLCGVPYSLAILTESARPIVFGTNNTLIATLDASGNLGVGVTPSAWVAGGNINLPASAGVVSTGLYLNTGSNYYYNNGFKYVGNGRATLFNQGDGGFQWQTASSNTGGAGAGLTFTPTMTLDASGRLGIGTASPATSLSIFTTDSNIATFTRDLATDVSFTIGADNSGVQLTSSVGSIQLWTGGTEKARLDASGRLGIGVSPTYPLHLQWNGQAEFRLTNSSGSGISAISMVAGGQTNPFYLYTDGNRNFIFQDSGTERFTIKGTGAIRYVPMASAPASPAAGDVYYDSSTNKLRCYNGTSWNDLF